MAKTPKKITTMEHRKQAVNPDDIQNDHVSAVERRFFQMETRASKRDDGKMVIGGRGTLFNRFTNMGWYAEMVEPGFFEGIKDDRAAVLLNHDSNHVLGRKRNGTMTWRVDADGAEYEAIIPESRADVYELVEKQYVYESSFGFSVAESKWAEVDRSLLAGKLSEKDLDDLTYGGKITVRYLTRGGELFDFSPVTFAAYEGTTTDTRYAKRSFDIWKGAQNEEESRDKKAAQQNNEIETLIDIALMERQRHNHIIKTQ